MGLSNLTDSHTSHLPDNDLVRNDILDYYTEVPEATNRIFKAMNDVHQRVLTDGDEAAVV